MYANRYTKYAEPTQICERKITLNSYLDLLDLLLGETDPFNKTASVLFVISIVGRKRAGSIEGEVDAKRADTVVGEHESKVTGVEALVDAVADVAFESPQAESAGHLRSRSRESLGAREFSSKVVGGIFAGRAGNVNVERGGLVQDQSWAELAGCGADGHGEGVGAGDQLS